MRLSPITPTAYTSQTGQTLWESKAAAAPGTVAGASSPSPKPLALGGAALADFNHDGILDMVLISQADDSGRLLLLLGQAKGGFAEATAGVDVAAEVTRWGGPVPPMFWLRDPDGNSLIVVQPAA